MVPDRSQGATVSRQNSFVIELAQTQTEGGDDDRSTEDRNRHLPLVRSDSEIREPLVSEQSHRHVLDLAEAQEAQKENDAKMILGMEDNDSNTEDCDFRKAVLSVTLLALFVLCISFVIIILMQTV